MDYIKAPRKVAELVGQVDNRSMLPDGNLILWERDLLSLHPYELEALGCLSLTAEEVRKEQMGGEPHMLPTPTDERVVEKEGGEV